MALKNNENKVKFGLKRVAFAIATIAEDGSATYGKPITFPGARALSMEPQGTGEPWYSDDGVYYYNTAPATRQGDLEMARMIDIFKRRVLQYVEDVNGVLLEDMNPETVHFALLFETMNDKRPRRYVMYNCVATAPAVGSNTNEGSKEPQTETTSINSMGIYVASHDKWFDHAESTPRTNSESYANWFNEVQLPAPPADPYFTETVSGAVVYIDDTVALPLKNLTIYGKSTQTGTPIPSDPVVIGTAGSGGTLAIKLSDGSTDTTHTLPTPNGLPGIKDASGGNYIDANGQQWICDTIDKATGKYTQRVGVFTLDGSYTPTTVETVGSYTRFWYQVSTTSMTPSTGTLCSHLPYDPSGYSQARAGFGIDASYPRNIWAKLPTSLVGSTAASIKTWMQSNHMTLVAAIAAPVTTDLTAEQVEVLGALYGYNGGTTVYVDDAVPTDIRVEAYVEDY